MLTSLDSTRAPPASVDSLRREGLRHADATLPQHVFRTFTMTRRRNAPEQSYLQPSFDQSPKKRRLGSATLPVRSFMVLFTVLALFISSSQAVYIPFQNCLDPGIVDSHPLQLQFVPLWVDATFSQSSERYLAMEVFGNVSGQATEGTYPPPDAKSWKDPKNTFGKITNYTTNPNGQEKYSTLFTKYNVLTYTAYNHVGEFCDSISNGTHCPVGPAFGVDPSDIAKLPAYSVGHAFYSSYAFASFQITTIIKSGATGAPSLACVSAIVTPALGNTLSGVLAYLPVVILLVVAAATMAASIFSPWGSTDLFKWTSNYGRDEDLLRLVTPGFGDCLQYIQFIVLAGSLSLSYPGYYQPAVRQVSWSALMFNQSFVSSGPGVQNPIDGIYAVNGTHGLDRMSQLVGVGAVDDLWAGMVIWTLVLLGAVVILCQIGFFSRWATRYISKTPEEDLRRKNWPFTAGNLVRIVCNYFFLPIVALSMFQLLITTQGPVVLSACAAILLIAIICFAAWVVRLIFTTKPRSLLFDDLPTVLLYGPLYNTYSDDAAPFALIPVLLTFIRGIAIGAVQDSGIAQLVILAICEVNLILTLYAFRPFHSPTSMNIYHTFFAVVRLVTVLLQIAFVPSLGVTEAPKGWIGYVILLLHGIVLIFGFFLNAIQTLIEVVARRAGAGGDRGSAPRGGLVKVFGMRQLSKRAKRPVFRSSQTSDANMLTADDDFKSFQNADRSRSLSQSSAILLSQRPPSDGRLSTHLDRFSSNDDFDSPREHGTFSFLPSEYKNRQGSGGPSQGIRSVETTDPYYRAPRPRRATGDLSNPAAKSRGSWASAELLNRNPEERDVEAVAPQDSNPAFRSFTPVQGTPIPAYIRGQATDSDPNVNDPRRSHVDYAVREVDFYYGVRGPALNNQPTRKLKTGPADPVGPVSSATGWFKGMLGWKTKDKGKGFEVVRSSRAPQEYSQDEEEGVRSPQPYTDAPEAPAEIILPGQRTRSTDLDRDYTFEDDQSKNDGPSPLNSDDERELEAKYGRKRRNKPLPKEPVSEFAPTLDTEIDSGSAIVLPSRFGSKASSVQPRRNDSNGSAPTVPRKSSKRDDGTELDERRRLSTVMDLDSPPQSPERRRSSTALALEAGNELPTSTSIGDRLASGNVPAERASVASGVSQLSGRHVLRDSVDSRVSALEEVPPGQPGYDRPIQQPTTYGYVHQYRTSDGIHAPLPATSEYRGASAEVVGDPPQPPSEADKNKNWPL